MSKYDATHPDTGSDRTLRVKQILTKLITDEMKTRGYKTIIKEEVPCVIENKKYHADLGVLTRSIKEHDFYFFFLMEIDWIIGHETYRQDRKERIRDDGFLLRYGIRTIRIPLAKVSGKSAIPGPDIFESLIWPDIVESYIDPGTQKNRLWAELNRNFAIQLKENSSTQCGNCQHKAAFHSLSGCEWQYTNKAKLRCNCRNPFYTSDF